MIISKEFMYIMIWFWFCFCFFNLNDYIVSQRNNKDLQNCFDINYDHVLSIWIFEGRICWKYTTNQCGNIYSYKYFYSFYNSFQNKSSQVFVFCWSVKPEGYFEFQKSRYTCIKIGSGYEDSIYYDFNLLHFGWIQSSYKNFIHYDFNFISFFYLHYHHQNKCHWSIIEWTILFRFSKFVVITMPLHWQATKTLI